MPSITISNMDVIIGVLCELFAQKINPAAKNICKNLDTKIIKDVSGL